MIPEHHHCKFNNFILQTDDNTSFLARNLEIYRQRNLTNSRVEMIPVIFWWYTHVKLRRIKSATVLGCTGCVTLCTDIKVRTLNRSQNTRHYWMRLLQLKQNKMVVKHPGKKVTKILRNISQILLKCMPFSKSNHNFQCVACPLAILASREIKFESFQGIWNDTTEIFGRLK